MPSELEKLGARAQQVVDVAADRPEGERAAPIVDALLAEHPRRTLVEQS